MPELPRHLTVAVCGTSTATAEQSDMARTVGRLLAEAGVTIVCGGLGGVMTAVGEGARAVEGSRVIGLLPGDEPGAANPFVDVALATGIGEMRNALIVRASHGMIAIGGGYGTLSEIAFALRLGRPVVGLRTWTFAPPDGAQLAPAMIVATTPAEAVQLLLRALGVPPAPFPLDAGF